MGLTGDAASLGVSILIDRKRIGTRNPESWRKKKQNSAVGRRQLGPEGRVGTEGSYEV